MLYFGDIFLNTSSKEIVDVGPILNVQNSHFHLMFNATAIVFNIAIYIQFYSHFIRFSGLKISRGIKILGYLTALIGSELEQFFFQFNFEIIMISWKIKTLAVNLLIMLRILLSISLLINSRIRWYLR